MTSLSGRSSVVEHNLAKVGVGGSNLLARSRDLFLTFKELKSTGLARRLLIVIGAQVFLADIFFGNEGHSSTSGNSGAIEANALRGAP